MQTYRAYQHVMRLPQSAASKPAARCDKTVKKPAVKRASQPAQQQQQRKKITRTKTGCLCCRRRKKKCDELKPGCSGCLRNNLQCVYPHTDDKMAAYILSEMAHAEVPAMCSPSSPHHSDMESPITSPKLAAQEPIKFILPLSIDTSKKTSAKRIASGSTNVISIKSLLN